MDPTYKLSILLEIPDQMPVITCEPKMNPLIYLLLTGIRGIKINSKTNHN